MVGRVDLEVGDHVGVEVVVRRCVEGGVLIPLFPPNVPALGQQAEGEEEEEGEGTHGTELALLGVDHIVFPL